jgi:mRNA-decapping enzyme subunit 2
MGRKRTKNGSNASSIDGDADDDDRNLEVSQDAVGNTNAASTSSVSARMRVCTLELAARFVLNAPPEEIADNNRLFFLVEQAHWYYEDFSRERDTKLPAKTFEAFAKEMFSSVEILKPKLKGFDNNVKEFKAYKFSIPTCGAVLLNPTMDKCLMVKGWGKHSKSLGFPKGKADANETEEECAAREVEEEIGVDIRNFIIPEDKVVFYRKRGADEFTQKNTLFIIQGISEDTKFLTHTRKEIGDIVWNPISIFERGGQTLKSKYGSVLPVLRTIVEWVRKKRKAHPKPKTNVVIAPESPAAGRAKAMSLQELENELLASAPEADDEPDEDATEPYVPFAALDGFRFDKPAIMRPFVRG